MNFRNLSRSLFVLLLLLAVVPAGAATLGVQAGAALEGNFGLAVNMTGDTVRTWVQDNSPNGETTYSAEFLIRRSTLDMIAPNNHSIFLAMDENPAPPHTGVIRLTILRVADGRYFIRAFAYQNTGAYRFVGGTGLGTNGNAIWSIRVEWQVSDPGLDNGFLRLYKNGGFQVERTDLINEGQEIDHIRLGAPSFVDASSAGTYHLDSFESFRTVSPAP